MTQIFSFCPNCNKNTESKNLSIIKVKDNEFEIKSKCTKCEKDKSQLFSDGILKRIKECIKRLLLLVLRSMKRTYYNCIYGN